MILHVFSLSVSSGQAPLLAPLVVGPQLAELRHYLNDALVKEWIQHSTSSAEASILFVPKKDRGLCLCVDYRGLNKVTGKNCRPLPLVSKTLDRLTGAKVFTKLDLKDTYHHI